MLQTSHVRAALHRVLAVIDATLAGEGFLRSTEALQATRVLVVAEKDGWVTIADDP